jgi:O-antigen ligase
VAAVVGLGVTAAFYFKHKQAWMATAIIFAVILPLMMTAADLHISSKERSQILRTNSMSNMSGRMTLWNVAFTKFWNKPILGYGFVVGGADAFANEAQGTETTEAPGKNAKYGKSFIPTLHNGFLQALLDSGMVGAFLYIAIIGWALWALLKHDTARQYGAELYALIFLTLSNFGETVVFSAGEYPGVFYWYVAVFAMSLNPTKRLATTPPQTKPESWAGYDRLKLAPVPKAPATALFSSQVQGKGRR